MLSVQEFVEANNSLEEFKALCCLRPSSLQEAEQIFFTIERFVREHPELKPQIDAYMDEVLNRETWMHIP